MRLGIGCAFGYMRLMADAFMSMRWAYALLSVVFFGMFNPGGDSFIEPLLPIIPYESVNFCLTFLIKYDKCGCSLDFLDSAFIICGMEPFRYVGIVYDS